MNKQKLISRLQSRIAKRKKQITFFLKVEKNHASRLATDQKHDKQLIRQLVEDERVIKMWERLYDFEKNFCNDK